MVNDGVEAGSFHHTDGIAGMAPEISDEAYIVENDVSEYRAISAALGLENLVISYPASGADISLEKVFSDSEIFYIDPEEGPIKTLQGAGLSENKHIVQADAYSYHHPKPVDMLVIRNDSTGNNNTLELAKDLREGGYVIVSHWMTSNSAKQFLDAGYNLVGITEKLDSTEHGFSLKRDTDGSIARALKEDKATHFDEVGLNPSKFKGRTFVFQKPPVVAPRAAAPVK